MPWKMNEDNSFAKDESGNPVWVRESGEEKAVDYIAMSQALMSASREAAERKAKLREYESKLEPLKEIDDLPSWMEDAKKALETVKTTPDKEKDVEDRIKGQIEAVTKPLKEQLARLEAEKAAADLRLQKETIGNAFSRSEYVRNKMVDPVVASDLFSKHFKLGKEGRLIAVDNNGQVIYSESGESEAPFDEALARLVDNYPGKSFLLKGSNAAGSGARPSGAATGMPVVSARKQFKNIADKTKFISEHGLEAYKNLSAE